MEDKERYEVEPARMHSVLMTPGVGVGPQCGAGVASVPFLQPSFTTLYERIRSNNDPKKRRDWKDCEHYRMTCDPYDCAPSRVPWCANSTSNIGWWNGNGPTSGIAPSLNGYVLLTNDPYSLYDPRLDGTFVPSPPHLDWLIRQSLSRMLPTIRAKLSGVNSVYELKDFVSIKSTVRNLANFGLGFFQRKIKTIKHKNKSGVVTREQAQIRKTFDRSFGQTLSEALRTGADGYLQASFNILPLLSDICGVQAALIETHSAVNSLLQGEGQEHNGYYTSSYFPTEYKKESSSTPFTISDDNGYSNGHCGVYGGMGLGCLLKRQYEVPKASFRARIKYRYYYSDFQRQHAQLLGLLDALGVNLNPAIIWNAIPWSFVIDWIVNVGNSLDSLKIMNLAPQLSVTGYMWSVKYKREIHSTIESYTTPPPGCLPVPLTRLPVVYEHAYKRKVGMPQVSSLATSGLSLKEASLGVALAITRRKPRNRARPAQNR
jgi:hypothetical protein